MVLYVLSYVKVVVCLAPEFEEHLSPGGMSKGPKTQTLMP